MITSKYKSYDELPLFLNAKMVAQVLGVSPLQWIRADARAELPGTEGGQPDSRAKGAVYPLGSGAHRRWLLYPRCKPCMPRLGGGGRPCPSPRF